MWADLEPKGAMPKTVQLTTSCPPRKPVQKQTPHAPPWLAATEELRRYRTRHPEIAYRLPPTPPSLSLYPFRWFQPIHPSIATSATHPTRPGSPAPDPGPHPV